MGKSKRKGGASTEKQELEFDSDDERAYANEKLPDPTDSSYFQDEVDDFHAKREKILLDKGASLEPAGFSSDEEEEVLGLGSDDDFDDDEEIQDYKKKLQHFRRQGFKDALASDIEDSDADDLPDVKAWGANRYKYYGTDVDENRHINFTGPEPDTAVLEEQEALAIQKKMAEQLEDQDFGLDIFQMVRKAPEPAEGQEKIVKDLSKLSEKEKLQLLKKESPELLDLIEDYKVKMTELRERLLPVFNLQKRGILPPSRGAEYVNTKVKLYLNYCVNVSFYMTLKAKHTPMHSHPVIRRLVQYRNLMKQMEAADEKIQPKLDELLDMIKKNEIQPSKVTSKRVKKVKTEEESESPKKTKKKRLLEALGNSSEDSDEDKETDLPQGGRTWGRKKGRKAADERYVTMDEKQALEYYQMLKSGKKKKTDQPSDDELGVRRDDLDQMEGEGDLEAEQVNDGNEGQGSMKRSITYEMSSNRGLTPHRKKEYRNPRVKHRIKYKKALVRRKGQVRPVRTEMERYGGELSGIRAGIKRSVKIN